MSLEVKQFSIKNFISDLPRLLNDAFKTVCDCINGFYDSEKDEINVQKANIDYIVATTIVAQNMKIADSSSGTYNFQSLIDRIEALENEMVNIHPITQAMLDADIDTNPPYRSSDASFYGA